MYKRQEENIARFVEFWDSFSVKRGYGWDANPWVWAYTFVRMKGVPKGGTKRVRV